MELHHIVVYYYPFRCLGGDFFGYHSFGDISEDAIAEPENRGES